MTVPGTAQETSSTAEFAQRFAATPRGARLARLLALQQLDDWGLTFGSPLSEDVCIVVGELTANAVRHGRVPGRDFGLRLSLGAGGRLVRVEVSDTHPGMPRPGDPDGQTEGGRGLLLVGVLAARWGVGRRRGPGKTVWAEVDGRRGGSDPGPQL